jgi:hypothetical protein
MKKIFIFTALSALMIAPGVSQAQSKRENRRKKCACCGRTSSKKKPETGIRSRIK